MKIFKKLLSIFTGILTFFFSLILGSTNDETENTPGEHSFTLDQHKSLPVDPNDPSKGRWMS